MAVTPWIPATERKPKPNVEVLVAVKEDGELVNEIAMWSRRERQWIEVKSLDALENVRLWMPIPAMPRAAA